MHRRNSTTKPSHLRLVSDRTLENNDGLAFAARESIGLLVVPMLALAQRRITEAELDVIDALCVAQPRCATRSETVRFRLQYWTKIIAAAHGSKRAAGMRWWIGAIGELEERLETSRPALVEHYQALALALRRRAGAVDYWLMLLEPVFDATEARLHLVATRAADKE